MYMDKQYEITDKDIEIALRYLKIYDPKNATPENAISLLEDLRQGFHSIAHTNPDLLEKLQKELDEHRKQK